ncbi:cysteine-rich receptor-like protein kinase 6 [Ipomoea triloba]|uniref:cysteine-rich receptor-like protein kinase 6 n=1 Tax=Ipomoea triloba TaxID=35885 RepID=UPI00125CD940|nr:cysteine-rich receptor-like protein kinase 6 [Ipomoea triloba]
MGDTMPNLEEVYLAGNKFYGTIPISFPNASKLQIFEVSQNHFIGKIPDNIGKLKHLFYLNLELNLLGKITPSLASLKSIKHLDISNNKLTGEIPRELQKVSLLKYLNLSFNDPEGSLIDICTEQLKASMKQILLVREALALFTKEDGGGRNNVLSVLQRLNITIDVASGLYYLHNDCEPPIIHCDLKPSNILLDKDLIANVGDFGLGRLYSRTIEDSSQKSSTLGLKGSIGCIAPKYGTGGNPSICGDIYSYGIFLLKMFTAKRPTYDFSGDDCSSLCEYFEAALPDDVMRIVDPLLLVCQETTME